MRTANRIQPISLAFLVPLALLITCVSLIGIYTPDFYANETLNWQVQSLGQDIIDLVLIVPTLLVLSLLTLKKKQMGLMLLNGVLLYLVYTFTIFCFDVHFNKLFILYCLILGLAFYSFLYLFYSQINERHLFKIEGMVRKIVAIYFIAIAFLFYFLWLSDIVPAINNNTVPKALVEAGLPTNPVHVIDLAIMLPGIFIVGVLLLQNKLLGTILTPAILVFFILMDITIAALSAMMKQKGLEGNLVLTLVMSALALGSLALLVWYFKSIKIAPKV